MDRLLAQKLGGTREINWVTMGLGAKKLHMNCKPCSMGYRCRPKLYDTRMHSPKYVFEKMFEFSRRVENLHIIE